MQAATYIYAGQPGQWFQGACLMLRQAWLAVRLVDSGSHRSGWHTGVATATQQAGNFLCVQ